MVRIYTFLIIAHNTARLNKMPVGMAPQDRREQARAANGSTTDAAPTVGQTGTGGDGRRAAPDSATKPPARRQGQQC